MPEPEVKCSQPARGPILPPADPDKTNSDTGTPPQEDVFMLARVGKPAPDFEAMAYHENGFKLVKLSEFDGEWRLLCFYPGDFTFV